MQTSCGSGWSVPCVSIQLTLSQTSSTRVPFKIEAGKNFKDRAKPPRLAGKFMHHAILIDDYDEDGPTAVGAAPSHAFEGGVGDSRAGFSVRALVPAPPRIPLPEHAAKSARTRKREALQVLRPRIHTAPIVLAAQGLHTSRTEIPAQPWSRFVFWPRCQLQMARRNEGQI